jgi:hypothetical protein
VIKSFVGQLKLKRDWGFRVFDLALAPSLRV